MSQRKIGSDADVLRRIVSHLNDRGYPPSVRELADEWEVSKASMHSLLQRLARDGHLDRPDRVARGMRVTSTGMKLVNAEEMK